MSFSSVAYYVGLIVGASFWGTTADLIGRKPAFNATILYGGVFACAVAGVQNFTGFCVLWAIIGTAAGGNVPVDSVVFLEFVPQTHQWLLVSLSGWWNLGQVIVSLLAWVFLANFACDSTEAPCRMQDNMGWRYLMITLGGIAIAFGLIRIVAFKIPESPKFLISKGRDAEAVDAVNYIARYNKRPETLTLEMLQAIDRQCAGFPESDAGSIAPAAAAVDPDMAPRGSKLSHMEILKESFRDYNADNYKKLFAGRKMAQHTSVTFLIWLTVGVAYPLYFAFIPSYLATKSTYSANTSLNHTYMIYCIVSAAGVLGPIAAGFCVETRFGRRWMMAASAVLTGVFLFAYTAVGTEAADIGFQCATGILGNFGKPVLKSFAEAISAISNQYLQSTPSCMPSRPSLSLAQFAEQALALPPLFFASVALRLRLCQRMRDTLLCRSMLVLLCGLWWACFASDCLMRLMGTLLSRYCVQVANVELGPWLKALMQSCKIMRTSISSLDPYSKAMQYVNLPRTLMMLRRYA